MKIFKVYSWCNESYYEENFNAGRYTVKDTYFAHLEDAKKFADGEAMEKAELCAIHNSYEDTGYLIINAETRKVEFTDCQWDTIIIHVEIEEIDVIE